MENTLEPAGMLLSPLESDELTAPEEDRIAMLAEELREAIRRKTARSD